MASTSQDVTIYEGTSYIFRYTTDRDLSTAEEVIWRMSAAANKKTPKLEKLKNATESDIVLDDNEATNDRATVSLVASETRIKAGEYYHELRVRETDDSDEDVLATGTFTILASNTGD